MYAPNKFVNHFGLIFTGIWRNVIFSNQEKTYTFRENLGPNRLDYSANTCPLHGIHLI